MLLEARPNVTGGLIDDGRSLMALPSQHQPIAFQAVERLAHRWCRGSRRSFARGEVRSPFFGSIAPGACDAALGYALRHQVANF